MTCPAAWRLWVVLSQELPCTELDVREPRRDGCLLGTPTPPRIGSRSLNEGNPVINHPQQGALLPEHISLPAG